MIGKTMAAKRSTSANSDAAGPERKAAKRANSAAGKSRQTHGAGSEQAAGHPSGDAAGRTQVQDAIGDLEARYKDLFESALDVILVVDASGNILDINRQGETLSGFTRAELLQSNVLRDLIIPEDREALGGVFRELIAGKSQIHEVRWRAKDGRVIALEGSSSPCFSREGEFLSMRCILRDITARKEMEQALRLTQFSVDHAGDAIFWLAPDGRFLYANSTACRRLGYSREELLSMTVHDIDPNFPAEVWPDHWRELKQRGSFTFESRHRAKDGRIFPVEITVNFLAFAGGEYNCAFAREITERKRAEEALRKAHDELEQRVEQRTAELARSNTDLQQFAYSASHDLQEPLRMMSSYLQALDQESREGLSEQARNFIHLSLDAAARMQRLINDLLAYAYVGTREEALESVDSGAVVDQVIADLAVAIRRERAEVTRDELPRVTADPTLLSQLFQNLIGNAIKFRGAQPPRVHVSARQSGREWVFSVRDNGIGIAPKDFSRIFVVFQRLHAAEQYPGTGIGLAICKRVVERHLGRIWCDSEPGKGTTFHFSLPQQQGSGA
jgi:PAS domain S-box-containing protein